MRKTRLLLDFAERGRGREGEDHNLFAGCRADIVVQAYDSDPGGLLHHGFHHGARGFDQVSADFVSEGLDPSPPRVPEPDAARRPSEHP